MRHSATYTVRQYGETETEEMKLIAIDNSDDETKTEVLFIVRYPFKQNIDNCLGNSKSNAWKKLIKLEKHYKKNPELKNQYVSFIREYKFYSIRLKRVLRNLSKTS